MLFIQALLKRTKQWNKGPCQEKSAVVPNIVWDSLRCKGLQSTVKLLFAPNDCMPFVNHQSIKKSLFLFSTFCRWNPGNPCVMSSVSVQWFPVKPLLAPLLMVHSLCPQQMWHAVSTVPSKLAAELSPAWKTQLVTQMACMTSASPSYTVLLNLTLRYTLLFIPTHAYTSLSLWAGVDHMGVTVRAKSVWTTSVFFFFLLFFSTG